MEVQILTPSFFSSVKVISAPYSDTRGPLSSRNPNDTTCVSSGYEGGEVEKDIHKNGTNTRSESNQRATTVDDCRCIRS